MMIKAIENELPAAPLMRMIMLGLILVSPSFLYGLNLAYPTVALPQMDLNVDDASWFGSLAVYVAPISSVLVGVIIDSLGRRTALLVCILPSIAGWSLLYCSQSVAHKLLGQALNGLSAGAVFYPCQVYAGECVMVNSIRLRNTFLTWVGLSSSLGTTAMLVMANMLDYRQVCVVPLTLSIVMLLVFVCAIPESPSWLHSRGRVSDARRAERRLGIRQPTLHECTDDAYLWAQQKNAAPLSWSHLYATLAKVARKDVYKPLLVLSMAGFLLPFSGMSTCTTYMIDIIDGHVPGVHHRTAPMPAQALAVAIAVDHLRPQPQPGNNTSGTTAAVAAAVATAAPDATSARYQASSSNKYSIVCGLFMCAGSVLSSVTLPRFGLKKMVIASNVAAVVGLVALTCAYNMEPSAGLVFVRIASVTLLAFLFGMILGPVSASSGDIFPADAKGFASLTDISASLSAASSNKVYPYLCLALGAYVYCVYSAMSVLGALYVYLFSPEVVGKTLEEINCKFLTKKKERR